MVIPAMGHSYTAKTIDPQLGIPGKTYKECSRCGDVIDEEEIPALNPDGTVIKSLKAASKAFTVKWTKKAYTGYQISYSLQSSMDSAKTVTITKNSTVSKKISKLKSKKKYYVQIRTYITVNGTNYYSDWSSKKSIKTK